MKTYIYLQVIPGTNVQQSEIVHSIVEHVEWHIRERRSVSNDYRKKVVSNVREWAKTSKPGDLLNMDGDMIIDITGGSQANLC